MAMFYKNDGKLFYRWSDTGFFKWFEKYDSPEEKKEYFGKITKRLFFREKNLLFIKNENSRT